VLCLMILVTYFRLKTASPRAVNSGSLTKTIDIVSHYLTSAIGSEEPLIIQIVTAGNPQSQRRLNFIYNGTKNETSSAQLRLKNKVHQYLILIPSRLFALQIQLFNFF
jgi:hypothetical protein